MHKMLLGIEHLMTGVQLREAPSDLDQHFGPYHETNPAIFHFQRESPSIVRVVCEKPFNSYWPHSGAYLESIECTPEEANTYESIKYGSGEAEWWAQVAGEVLRQTYHLPTASITGNQPPDAVIRAMRRKHGKEADKYIQQLRWDAMNKYWYYAYDGMYLGVEQDGYIHS